VPRSAATRIALAGSAAFALAVALLGVLSYHVVDRALRVQLDDRIAAEASSLVSEYRGEGEAGLRHVIERREVARATNDLGYGLFDAAGRRIAGALEATRPTAGWQTLMFFDPAEGHRELGRGLAVDIAPGRRLVVAADWNSVHHVDRIMLGLLAVALGATVAIGTLGAVLLATYLRRRLSVMAEGAEAIIAGDLGQRIPVGRRRDEFDRLAAALNAMLDRIAVLLDNLRQVSGDVAHDLRQPLARLRNLLEAGMAGGDANRTVERALDQVDHVLALFASLLRLSEIEAGRLRAGFGPVDLAQLAVDLGESYAPAMEDDGRRLFVVVAEAAVVAGDAELLSQAVVNLLDNAQVHTPVGTTVRLAIQAMPDRIALSVTDDGPGVAVDDRERVLNRFVRLEVSRHRPGHGLGLSLVAAIARAHGARLVLGDNDPGLAVTIAFPR
jgi:hypothetical protein